jgi:hypothetical protein
MTDTSLVGRVLAIFGRGLDIQLYGHLELLARPTQNIDPKITQDTFQSHRDIFRHHCPGHDLRLKRILPKKLQALPTLEDVARRAGTSVATAGRALGGYGKVAQATRDRILVAARELNYYPNVLARSMKQRLGLTIGLIVGNICNSFFSTAVRAIESTVSRHGYKVIVCNTDESTEMELIYARALMELRVDGIIVSPTANENGEVSWPSGK